MHLKSLWIDGYKNLNDFKIDFKNRDGITVLIGNNASGKSNILEAISAIFARLYDDTLKDLSFKFDLVYQVDGGLDIRVSKKNKIKFRYKKSSNKSWKGIKTLHSLDSRLPAKFPITFNDPDIFSPSQVIALYSGEELRLWEDFYEKPYLDYNKKSLATDSYLSKQNMLYINKYYWDIALLTMYASDMDSNGEIEKIIKSSLKDIEFKINLNNLHAFILKKPNNEINIFTFDLISFYYREKEGFEVVTPDSFGDLWEAKKLFILNLDDFKNACNFKTHTELFNLLCVARLPKDEKHKLITSLELTFENGTTTKDLSEGQKKQILLKLALEVLADENSLLLFDEPDAHIHIANKKLIPEMLKEYEGNREIILTTHSPTLTHSFNDKHLSYVENGKINEDYNTQEKLLNELTNGFMGVSEQQLLLQSNKDILIVEGKTDDAYISQALKVLKEDEPKYQGLDFHFLRLGGSDPDDFNKIISIFKPKENQTIIAFFDSDDAGYNKCIKKVLNISTDKKDFKGSKKDGIHIHLYPKKAGFSEGNFEVEDYFPIKVLRDFVITQDSKNFQSVKNKFDKNKFVKKCKGDDFDKSNFDGFKTLFDKILEIKNK